MSPIPFRLHITILCLILVTTSAASAAINTSPILYRGWQDARELTNGDTRVVILPSVGARVVVFSWRGQNVLMEDPSLNGVVLKPGESWGPWDGSQPDTLQPGGNGNQLLNIWMGSYEVTHADCLHLKCRSLPNKVAGIQEEKEFILDRKKPLLTIKRRLINTGAKPARWAFWDRTLVPAGSIGVAPVTTTPLTPGGWATNRDGKYVPGGPTGGNPSLVNRMLIVHTVGKGVGAYWNAREGWLGAIVNGLFFKTSYVLFPKQEYAWPGGLNSGFYYADNRIEMEPTSPLFNLEPGKSAEWIVHWSLQSLGDIPPDPANLAAKIARLAAKSE